MLMFRKQVIFTWFLLLVCCFPISAQAIQCDKAQSKAEQLICSSLTLKKLDAQLNDVYKAVLAKQKGLQAEQKKWLETVRDACTTEECLVWAYRVRIDQLQYFEKIDKPLSEQEAKDACKKITELTASGRLSELAVPMRELSEFSAELDGQSDMLWSLSKEEEDHLKRIHKIGAGPIWPIGIYNVQFARNEKPQRYVLFSATFRVLSHDIYSLSYLMNSEEGDYGTEEVVGLNYDPAHFNSGQEVDLVMYKGRYYKIAGQRWSTIFWLKPGGKFRSICEIGQTSTVKWAQDKHEVLCTKMVNRSVKALNSWERPREFDPNEFDVGEYYEDSYFLDRLSYTEIDLDSSGSPQKIGELLYRMDGLPGEIRTRLVVLSQNMNSIQQTPLNEALGKLGGSANGIYENDNKYYIRFDNQDGGGLVQIRQGQVQRICTFASKSKITRFFKP